MTNLDWEINIMNLVTSVVEKFGVAVANSVFRRYGATSFGDLSPSDYWSVYGDLMQIDSDD